MTDLLERFGSHHVPEEAIRELIDNKDQTEIEDWFHSHRAMNEEELSRYLELNF